MTWRSQDILRQPEYSMQRSLYKGMVRDGIIEHQLLKLSHCVPPFFNHIILQQGRKFGSKNQSVILNMIKQGQHPKTPIAQ